MASVHHALPVPRDRNGSRPEHETDPSFSPSYLSSRGKPRLGIDTSANPKNRQSDHSTDRPTSPASPEVISSLITSLSTISNPVNKHFGGPAFLTLPGIRTPVSASSGGSFGLDYGAFATRGFDSLHEARHRFPVDDLAAAPPAIRTSKLPSGRSALTAPQSPRSSARDVSSGLRSFLSRSSSGNLRESRPSSRGSRMSNAESVGNPSIERSPGSQTSPRDTTQFDAPLSHWQASPRDSWGKKGRLMYMTSKEQIREQQAEKRSSFGNTGRTSPGPNSLAGDKTLRAEQFLAELIISEEPAADSPPIPRHPGPVQHPERTSSLYPPADVRNQSPVSPRPIPARDSSLRASKRSSLRASMRSSKHSEGGTNEDEEKIGSDAKTEPRDSRDARDSRSHRLHPRSGRETDLKLDLDVARLSADLPPHSPSLTLAHRLPPSDPYGSRTAPLSSNNKVGLAINTAMTSTQGNDVEEGAPSPAIAQGRHSRRSGLQQAPEPLSGYNSGYESGGETKCRRSSSRLKRLSGAGSPSGENGDDVSTSGGTKLSRNKRTSTSQRRNSSAGNRSQTDQPNVVYERPGSADSIDDAVESFLCSPRLTQKIRHPQTGRVISFSEVGDPSGFAVFCCVGMGLTRYITAFYDELALTLKLRLITPDRPGVGDSEPYTDGTTTPLQWPDDVYAICQGLKITKFSILAHSAGAIYALATALRMPQHIRGRIHLLAPWIPPSQMSVFGASAQTPLPPTNAIPTSQRILRALPTPILKAANSSFMSATSSSITSSLPKQKRAKREKKDKKDKDANTSKTASPAPPPDKEDLPAGFDKSLSPVPPRSASENMDLIQPTGKPTGDGGFGSLGGGAPGHRHQRSNSSVTRRLLVDHDLWARERQTQEVLDEAERAASMAAAQRERTALYDNRLTHAIWQLATTGANPAVDLLVCLERRHAIGFRYVDITRPVVIHHGSRDTRVPVDNVRWLGKTMRRCEVRVLEGQGHGLMASAQVMGSILMEVSREWEEWGRVTSSAGPGGGGGGGGGRRERRATLGR